MSLNKEEILANFQSISGIDDVAEAFCHLEDAGWDLMAAIQRVLPQDDQQQIVDMPPAPLEATNYLNSNLMNNFSSNVSTSTSNTNIRWNTNHNTATIRNEFLPVASTSNNLEDSMLDLSGNDDDDDLTAATPNDIRSIIFNIHYNQQIFIIRLASNATIELLKKKINDATQVPLCRQALRGWPPNCNQEAQKSDTRLSSLELSSENELILIDMTEDGFTEFDNDEMNGRLDDTFKLTIVEEPSGRIYNLNLPGRTTISEAKTKLYYVSDIQVRHQEWIGWPHGANSETTLAQSGIDLSHNFILQNTAGRNSNRSATTRSANDIAIDTDSSADEFEDATDFNNCEDFFTDSPTVQPPSRFLIPNNTDDEIAGSIQFLDNYKRRYGEPHPDFFTGSLADAIRDACNKPARERKLVGIYLHHGESILINVFCDHLMKHESIVQTFAQNFILYGWDLTFESNKHLFLSSVTACVSSTASLTVRNIPLDKLPAILVIGKSRLSGRSTCEVLSVIHGNVGLDDLLSRLIESVEVYNEHLQVEIREEDERAARDQVKAEQDMAYQATLQADMAKDAAKKQKEAAMAAERQRIESEKAEEDARRESIRLVAEQSLPAEPNINDTNVAKIRVRKPTGDFLERRFYIQNSLQDLLNFVASNGFLIDEYKLISSWPRRDLTAIDANQTLQSLKLYPQETVILEER